MACLSGGQEHTRRDFVSSDVGSGDVQEKITASFGLLQSIF